MKTCTTCNVSKPTSEFHLRTNLKGDKVLKTQCKSCKNSYNKECRDKNGPEIMRNYHLKKKYGITQQDYTLMLEQQGNACLICLTPAKTPSHLHVDHNHDTGAVRGLLCPNCNVALGKFKDDPAVLAKAINYLLEKGDYSQL